MKQNWILSSHFNPFTGVETAIYSRAEEYLIQTDSKYVIVETSSNIVENEPYVRTRRFYENIGVEPLIILTEMWNGNTSDHCLNCYLE